MLAADAARANGDMTSARERYARAEEITPTRPEAAFGAAVATITIDPVLAPDAVAALRRRFPDPSPAWAQIGAACERAEQGQLASREADWRDRRRR